MIKKFFHIIIWGLLIAGVVVALAFVEQKHSKTVCEQFELLVENQDYDALTNAEELRSLVIAGTDTLPGKTLAEIDPYSIHLILDRNPYVKYADIQTGIDGKLKITVTLRKAIVRILNKDNVSYYIDSEGWLMPINPGFPARVLVVNGAVKDGIKVLHTRQLHVDSLPDNSMVHELFRFAKYTSGNQFLNKLIGQVWVSSAGEMELIPVIGEHTILFGGFDEMENKFEKLLAYYKQGAGKAGWIDYRSIDLRYSNQVICSK